MVGGVELILGFIPTSSRELGWGRPIGWRF